MTVHIYILIIKDTLTGYKSVFPQQYEYLQCHIKIETHPPIIRFDQYVTKLCFQEYLDSQCHYFILC